MKEKYTCCFCKKEFKGFGNSAWPVKERGTCCDDCNRKIIVPTRLARMVNLNIKGE